MERLHNRVRHTHELVIYGGREHALCREVTNGPCGVAQTEREHYQGASGEVFWGGRFPSSKLHHDVGEREGEAA